MRLAGLLVLALLIPGGAIAQDAPAVRDPVPAGGLGAEEQQGLGLLSLEISPGARVSVTDSVSEAMLRVSLWHQKGALGTQIASAGVPAIASFNAVPISRDAMRLDLRLDPSVKGVSVVRSAPDRLEISFADRAFAGSAVRLQRKRARAEADRPNRRLDQQLADVLETPVAEAPTWVHWDPVIWPIGTTSPVQVRLSLDVQPHPFGVPPVEVRQLWSTVPEVAEAITEADRGEVIEAIRALAKLPTPNDDTRALVALARGHVWGRPGPDGDLSNAGRSADAFLLAAALKPNAEWAGWAWGRAGYGFERERRFEEALIQYRRAVEADPDHEERPDWDVGLGLCLIQMHRTGPGIQQIASALGSLPVSASAVRFEARRAVAHALWSEGDSTRAAAVVDLLLAENPQQARDVQHDIRWARMYLDAGRTAAAMPFLERIESDGDRRVERERARWWLHEASLVHHDSLQSRRWLKVIVDETPGSTLVPLAKVRMEVLDAIEAEGEGQQVSWQEVALHLRTKALEWPYTVVEDEALSLTAQLFVHLGMLEEGLRMYRWIQTRSLSGPGPIAWEHFVCSAGPRAFHELRGRGELTRALGIYRGFLDDPVVRGCVDISTRSDAASVALTAGLPDLASRWLGQAVAEGNGGQDETRNLVQLASIYLSEGKTDAAERTLVYLEGTNLPQPPGLVDSAWGDVQYELGQFDEAVASYSAAMEDVTSTRRTRGLVPSLQYRRGLAAEKAGDLEVALADLRAGVEGGGATDEVLGRVRLASILVRAGSDDSDFEAALAACDAAAAADPDGVQKRAVHWYRSLALAALGRDAEADALVGELLEDSDSWALLARERRAGAEFDDAVDALLAPPLD